MNERVIIADLYDDACKFADECRNYLYDWDGVSY